MSQDPVFWELKQNLANPQSLNSYSYAEGNPVNRRDPEGRSIADTLASIQNKINAIQTQINVLKQQISSSASYATLSVGTGVQSYSQGSGIINQAVNTLTKDNTAAYVAGGIGESSPIHI